MQTIRHRLQQSRCDWFGSEDMDMTNDVEQGSAGSETRSKWAALAVLALAQLMVVLDTTS